jgi:hypothetical protein
VNGRDPRRYERAFGWLLAVGVVVRLGMSAGPGLGADECNHWLYAAFPAAGYFDHPPMVGLLVRATTLGTQLTHPVFVRLSGALFHLGTAWLVWRIARDAAGRRAAWFAALMYHLSFSFFLSVVVILPDTSLLFFWLLTLHLVWRGIRPESPGRRERALVLLAGIPMGLAMLSKYHGLLLAPSLLLALLADRKRRRWLLRPEPWGAIAGATLLFLPTLLWNAEHDFASFRFQGSRGLFSAITSLLLGGGDPVRVDVGWSLQYVLGQAVWTHVLVFAFIVAGMLAWLRGRRRLREGCGRFLLCCALPLIALFTLNAAGNPRSLPHWTTAGWITLLPFAGAWLATRGRSRGLFPLHGVTATLTITLVAYGLATVQVAFAPLDLSRLSERFAPVPKEPYPDGVGLVRDLGTGDFFLETVGGRELREGFLRLREEDFARGRMRGDPFLLTRQWYVAGRVHHELHGPTGMEVACWGPLRHIGSMAFLQDWSIEPGRDAYCIFSSARYKHRYRPEIAYPGAFAAVEEPEVLDVRRGGRVVLRWFVFRCRGLRAVPERPHLR